MKLDSRILEGKKPLDCFDVEEAKEFLGKECYFSDHLCTFNELLDAYSYVTADMLVSKEKHLYVGELLTVGDSDGSCYEAGINGEAEWFQFCLPCEWVKSEESEKKYRPYTIKDFRKAFVNEKLDVFIILRDKHNPDDIYTLRYNGSVRKGRFEYIYLGDKIFSFKSLFENYEVADYNGNWQPFGVKEIPKYRRVTGHEGKHPRKTR